MASDAKTRVREAAPARTGVRSGGMHGGVHHEPSKNALQGEGEMGDFIARPAVVHESVAFNGFTYHGGPVVSCPLAHTYCITTAPSPIPRLSPGPTARPALTSDVARVPERLFPLPPVVYDVRAGQPSMAKSEVESFLRRVFYPLNHAHLFGDFAGLLREVAETIDQTKTKTH